MSKHLNQEEIENRLGAVMKAFSEENAKGVCNMNSVANLLEKGGYRIILKGRLKENNRRSEDEVNESIIKSIRGLNNFVNRVSDIVHKGSESADLNELIDKNIAFWNKIKELFPNK